MALVSARQPYSSVARVARGVAAGQPAPPPMISGSVLSSVSVGSNRLRPATASCTVRGGSVDVGGRRVLQQEEYLAMSARGPSQGQLRQSASGPLRNPRSDGPLQGVSGGLNTPRRIRRLPPQTYRAPAMQSPQEMRQASTMGHNVVLPGSAGEGKMGFVTHVVDRDAIPIEHWRTGVTTRWNDLRNELSRRKEPSVQGTQKKETTVARRGTIQRSQRRATRHHSAKPKARDEAPCSEAACGFTSNFLSSRAASSQRLETSAKPAFTGFSRSKPQAAPSTPPQPRPQPSSRSDLHHTASCNWWDSRCEASVSRSTKGFDRPPSARQRKDLELHTGDSVLTGGSCSAFVQGDAEESFLSWPDRVLSKPSASRRSTGNLCTPRSARERKARELSSSVLGGSKDIAGIERHSSTPAIRRQLFDASVDRAGDRANRGFLSPRDKRIQSLKSQWQP
mmetsp:Transcript_40122/g.90129  ORF Transcript_40122/g.90129 Transcript_40122/m.90129 type:complete len:451 (-) Transcript_40122:70-1422(-)